MIAPGPITVYDSQTDAYHQAFQVFLDHTDQKLRAREWLERLVQALPSRRAFIDIGAGNGMVTSWFTDSFDRTIASEPNESLRTELTRTCPHVEVHPLKILDLSIPVAGDLVLCSHVLYYIDGSEWMSNLKRLASFVAPEGVLVVVVQHHKSDCMQMLDHFLGRRFDLPALGRCFTAEMGDRYDVAVETVPASITTSDLASAYTVAEFMLNLLPLPDPPRRSDLETYVQRHFTRQGGSYRFSCDQDFLQIRPRPG